MALIALPAVEPLWNLRTDVIQNGLRGLGMAALSLMMATAACSEGVVLAGETTDATDDAIQKSIVSVYAK